ncbi:MAG TPA: DUF4115 domain-containing protein [Acidimicrobiales bacterium]
MTVLVTWLVVAVVVVAVAAVVAARRRSRDDEHSVSDYHRQLHTLEVLRHPSEGGKEGEEGAAFPDTAFRVTSSSSTTVRLTEPGKPVVPPVPPPPVADPSKPVTFDDAGPVISTPAAGHGTPWLDDKAMHGINHRPRRLAAPALAVVVVSAVIVVLLVTGSHAPKPSHQATGSSHTTTTTHHVTTTSATHRVTTRGRTTPPRHHGSTTTTTIPVVSLPHAGSAHTAVYAVKPSSYSLAMSATTAECWVDATEAGSGTVLYTGVLAPGQTETVQATGGVSVVVGAPNSFAANINGTSVSFPFGYQAPFTMQFLVASTSTST